MVVAKLVSKAKKKSLRIHDEKGLVIFLFSVLFDLLTLACVSTQEELPCEIQGQPIQLHSMCTSWCVL